MSEFTELLQTAVDNGPTTVAVVGGGLGLRRVVGPSLDAIGGALGKFTQYRAENLLRIGEKASRRLEDEDGDLDAESVHPRVAKEILGEGSWIDDDLHQEYLAGLLVGARTKDGASDNQAYLARIATALTADQVRMHYATISAYSGYWDGAGECPFPFHQKDHYRRHAIRVTLEDAVQTFSTFENTARGLLREGLLQDFGRPRAGGGGLDEIYTALVPSPLAFDLYLHALARPGNLGQKGLLMSRDRLAAARHTPAGKELRIAYPEPEPDVFKTTAVYDLGF